MKFALFLPRVQSTLLLLFLGKWDRMKVFSKKKKGGCESSKMGGKKLSFLR